MQFETDLETWTNVLVAVDLRILDLLKIEATLRSSSLCREQYESLEAFADNLRRKIRDVPKDSQQGDSQGS